MLDQFGQEIPEGTELWYARDVCLHFKISNRKLRSLVNKKLVRFTKEVPPGMVGATAATKFIVYEDVQQAMGSQPTRVSGPKKRKPKSKPDDVGKVPVIPNHDTPGGDPKKGSGDSEDDDREKIKAQDLNRLKAIKTKQETELNDLKIQDKVQAIKEEEMEKFLNIGARIIGEFKSWPRHLDLNEDQRIKFNTLLSGMIERLAEERTDFEEEKKK